MDCLFIEASAKTAVGVSETFREVVERIIDTPELWAAAVDKSRSGAAKPTRTAGKNAPTAMTLPGSITLDEGEHDAYEGGCSC